MFGVNVRAKDRKGKKVFYGWWIVGAGSLSQAYTAGAFWQGFGAFFDLIIEHFHWSRAVTSAAVSIQRTESGMIAPFVGYFIDRFGPKSVMLFGVITTSAGFIFLSRVQNLWQFYLAFTIITLGMAFGTFMVITTTIANWFVEKRSRALGIAMTGTGLGGALVPLLIILIDHTDWRTALVWVGVGYLLTGIPVALMMRRRPEDYGLLPDGREPEVEDQSGTIPEASATAETQDPAPRTSRLRAEAQFTVKEAVRTRAFWQLAIALGAGQLAMSASIHQIPAMVSSGVSRETAGLMIMGASMFSMAGRLASGFVGDSVDKRYVIAGSFACQMVGLLFLAYGASVLPLVGFMFFWGIGWGGSVPVRFALIADYFGRRSFGSIMGTLSTVTTLFGIGGPVFVGWLADERGNYRDPFLIMALSVVISIPLILTLRSPRGGSAGRVE